LDTDRQRKTLKGAASSPASSVSLFDVCLHPAVLCLTFLSCLPSPLLDLLERVTFYSLRRQGMDSMNAAGTSESDFRMHVGHNQDSWTFVVSTSIDPTF
jgi:hypothetical protein